MKKKDSFEKKPKTEMAMLTERLGSVNAQNNLIPITMRLSRRMDKLCQIKRSRSISTAFAVDYFGIRSKAMKALANYKSSRNQSSSQFNTNSGQD